MWIENKVTCLSFELVQGPVIGVDNFNVIIVSLVIGT